MITYCPILVESGKTYLEIRLFSPVCEKLLASHHWQEVVLAQRYNQTSEVCQYYRRYNKSCNNRHTM